MGYIYLRTNKINGKKYVGQVTTKRFKERQNRWNNLNLPYAGNVINNARKKYGIDAFDSWCDKHQRICIPIAYWCALRYLLIYLHRSGIVVCNES